MAKLYYGTDKTGGFCAIDGKGGNIRGIEIVYIGIITIVDNTPKGFILMENKPEYKERILIFPDLIHFQGESLSDIRTLFTYEGSLRITSVLACDERAENVPVTIHKMMDYSELLNTKAEDMTTKSEDLSATYVSGKMVAKTTSNRPNLNNQYTSGSGSLYEPELYLEDGTLYIGDFHIHLADNSAMTGKIHTSESQNLYFKNGKSTKNPTLVPYGVIEQNNRRKMTKLKSKRLINRRKY